MASGSASKEDRKNPSSGKRVAVVGAGVSGLAAAYKLKSHGLKVTVFEAEGRAGGKLRSVSYDGLIWDEGANTMGLESYGEGEYRLERVGACTWEVGESWSLHMEKLPLLTKKNYLQLSFTLTLPLKLKVV